MNRFSLFSAVALVVFGTFSLPTFGAQSVSNANRGKSYAVIFGVETFPSLPDFGDLPGAVNDMTALRDRWFDAPEFEGRVYSLVEGANGLAPTRANFEETLDAIAKLTTDRDAIYVCVATHGIAALNRSFLCPRDAIGADLSDATSETIDEKARTQGLISVSSLLERLEKTPGRKVLIIDACREKAPNDQESDFLKEFEDRLRRNAHANLAVISSCCLGQVAHDISVEAGRRRGRFGYYFLEGLEGKADLTGAYDGQITLIEAYNYANEQTKRDAEANGQTQTPELYEANDANNLHGVDRLVLTSRDLFAERFDEETLALESDAFFAARAGDYLVKKQPELTTQRAPNDYPLAEDAFDFALQTQPGNRLARNLRGYARRAQGDYAGALEDFNRVGAELTLFVDGATARRDANGKIVKQAALYRTPDGPADLNDGVTSGAILTIDKVENERLRVAAYNSRPVKYEFWVDAKNVGWTRTQAETAISGSAATQSRNLAFSATTPPSAPPPSPITNSIQNL